MPADLEDQPNRRLRPYDVLVALNKRAETWPGMIAPLRGDRRFRSSAAHAVLMALHRHYNWSTFAIAMPVTVGRARPAQAVDLARETRLSPRTVGAIMRWLTDEQKVLVTVRGHGWTGAQVRRFNVAALGLSEPESVTATTFRSDRSLERESVMAAPESVMASGFRDQKQETVTNKTSGEVGESGGPPPPDHHDTGPETDRSELISGTKGGRSRSLSDAQVLDRWRGLVVAALPPGDNPYDQSKRILEKAVPSVEGQQLVVTLAYGTWVIQAQRRLPDLLPLVRGWLGPDATVEIREQARPLMSTLRIGWAVNCRRAVGVRS